MKMRTREIASHTGVASSLTQEGKTGIYLSHGSGYFQETHSLLSIAGGVMKRSNGITMRNWKMRFLFAVVLICGFAWALFGATN